MTRVSAGAIEGGATGQQASQLAFDRPIGLSIFEIVRKAAESLWDSNRAAELAVITGYSAGQMQRVLVGKRRMSADRALRLIFSGVDEGAILEAFLDSYAPEQRGRALKALSATVRRFQLRQELDELEQSRSVRKSRR